MEKKPKNKNKTTTTDWFRKVKIYKHIYKFIKADTKDIHPSITEPILDKIIPVTLEQISTNEFKSHCRKSL